MKAAATDRRRATAAALCLVSLLALPAAAQDSLAERAGDQVQAALAEQEQRRGVALGVAHETLPAFAPHVQDGAGVQQSMLWARRRAVAVGFGVEQRAAPLPLNAAVAPAMQPALPDQRLLVGVSVAATERVSIAMHTPVWSDARLRAAEAAQPGGMNLRSRDAARDLKDALSLKMQFRDSATSLSVRPRKGGVGVTLRSQW
jgi:hypothetical protein